MIMAEIRERAVNDSILGVAPVVKLKLRHANRALLPGMRPP